MRFSRKRKMLEGADERALLVAVVFVLCALLSSMVQADEVRTVEGLEFSKVQLMGANELEITQGATAILKIRGDEDELEPLPFYVYGDTLRLGMTRKGRSVSDMKYKLTTPGLEALRLEGSGEAYVRPLAVGDLLLSLEGSGSIRMFDVQALAMEVRVIGSGDLQAVNVMARDTRLSVKGSGAIVFGSLQSDVVRAHMAGSGDIVVQDGGQAESVEARVLGSGDVDLSELTASTADVAIMGSGDVNLYVEKSMEVEIMGSGDLLYGGDPSVASSVLGSGQIRQRD